MTSSIEMAASELDANVAPLPDGAGITPVRASQENVAGGVPPPGVRLLGGLAVVEPDPALPVVELPEPVLPVVVVPVGVVDAEPAAELMASRYVVA